MKVVDAHTGREVTVGDTLPIPGGDGYYKVIAITPGLLTARILLASNHPAFDGWVPLIVRWTHPSWFLQHVAFIPS